MAKALSALHFARNIGHAFAFGVDGENAAAELRRLADAVDAREIVLQSVRVTSLASLDDFTRTGLRIVFAEKFETPAKELHASDSHFPVAVAPAL